MAEVIQLLKFSKGEGADYNPTIAQPLLQISNQSQDSNLVCPIRWLHN
jgi:hypothetical protein